MSQPTTASPAELVRAIHTSPTASAVVVAGAGTAAVAWLMGQPGASRTVLDAQAPYARPALDEYIGRPAEQHVSVEEAAAMAEEAYWRGLRLDAESRPGHIGERPVLGLACSATIATDRPKRGDHRAHAAVRSTGLLLTASIIFEKGARDRAGEETVVSRLLLNLLAEASGVPGRLPLELGEADSISTRSSAVDHPVVRVAVGRADIASIDRSGAQEQSGPAAGVVIAGSFNPLHDGHRLLAAAASRITGKESIFEISVTNVEKPPLGLAVLDARLSQARRRWPLAVTRAPTFAEKSRLMPGSSFAIGYDTALRLFDERFYPPYDPEADPDMTETAWGAALAEIRGNGCGFLVAGRVESGRFMTVSDLDIPRGFLDMFGGIPESEFRFDGSSSEIRDQG